MLAVCLLNVFKKIYLNLAYAFMLSMLILLPFEQVSFAVSLPNSITSNTAIPLSFEPTVAPSSPTSTSTKHPTTRPKMSASLPHSKTTTLTQSNSYSVTSNALSFNGSYSYSVDSRTGQLSTGAVVASGLFAKGTQKRNLVVSYSSLSGQNRFGLGKNWSFNIGYSDHSTHQNVVLSNGKSFHMIKNAKGEWVAQYHKLKDVHITGSPTAGWTFYLLNGVIEHINREGYESWEEDALGHRLTFRYEHTREYAYLTQMCDANQHCVTLKYGANKVNVWSLYPNGRREYTQIILSRTDDQNTIEVTGISLPGQHRLTTRYEYTNNVSSGMRTQRDYLNKIIGPAGGQVNFIWNDSNHQTHLNEHGLPISSAQGMKGAYLPVVTEQEVNPGDYEPSMRMLYRYGNVRSTHNFTGYGLVGVDYVPHQDPLLHNNAASGYTYYTSTDNGQVTVITRYNRFHLPTQRIEKTDGNQTLLSVTHFLYHLKLASSFKDQVPTYSLPIEEATTIYNSLNPAVPPVIKTVYMRYNPAGLVTFKQDPYGRQMYTTYCPAQGNKDCPTLGAALPFATYPHQILVVPAKIAHQPRPAMLVKTYHYTSVHAQNNPQIISLLPSRIELSQQAHNYPASPLLHHLPAGEGSVLGSVLINTHNVTSFSVAAVLQHTLLPAKSFVTNTFYYQMNPSQPDYAQLIASHTLNTSGDLATGALNEESLAIVRDYHSVAGHPNQATVTTKSYQSPSGRLADVFDVHTGKLSSHAIQVASATCAMYTGKLLFSTDRNHFFKTTYQYNSLGQVIKGVGYKGFCR